MAKEITIAHIDPNIQQKREKTMFGGKVKTGNFQEAISSVLATVQFLGVMPVVGVTDDSASDIHFKWDAYRTIFSIICSAIIFGYTLLSIFTLFVLDATVDQMGSILFFTSAMFGMYRFVVIAKKWPRIMTRWEMLEAKLPVYHTSKEKYRLSFKVKLYAFGYLFFALIEHVLKILSNIYFVEYCGSEDNLTEAYFHERLEALGAITKYSWWKVILGELSYVLAGFVWNYMNVFVVIVSFGLTAMFQQLNGEILKNKKRPMSEDYWEARRAQYRSIGKLCRHVDKLIAPITTIALGNNLFFVCIQMMKSLKPKPNVMDIIYFWYSFIFLLSRTVVFSLLTAAVHDESKKPVNVLRDVPSKTWCSEVERFIEEVVCSTIALSGMRFFFMTRKLILSVGATILTYELVLMQFEDDQEQLLRC